MSSVALLNDFRDYARSRLEGFTGREWLVEKVRAWLGRADAPPFLLILGEPGIGKSAFAAHLWLDHGLPHAVHFCIAGRGGTIDPLAFVESLHEQLKKNLPGFAEAFHRVQEERYAEARRPIHAEAHVQTGDVAPGGEVIGVKIIQPIRDLPPEGALDFALRRPLQRMAENGVLPRTILLVDALDEARTYFSRPNILDLLARVRDFPPPVRFLLLSRREPDILGAFREMPVEVIHAESEENRRDVTAYLHRAWEQDPALRQAVQAWGAEWDADTFAARLGERSEWNFLYLRGVLPLIARRKVPDPTKLPAGLDGFHEYLLRTRIGEREWLAWGAELMETLLALQEPATPEHLARLLGWEVRPTHQRLLRISELLDPATLKQDRYWRYHWSLAEFVADRQRAGIWWCDLRTAHRRIAHHYLSEWGGLEQGLPGLRQRETRRADAGYGLRHLGAHLLAGGETETLRRLLKLEHEGRNLWFTVQEEEGQTAVFLEDVRRLWAWAREENKRAVAQGKEAPHLGDEIRCALIKASLGSLAGNIPPALLAGLVEKGVWTAAQGLAYARQAPDPCQRARALTALARHFPEALPEALAAAREIQNANDRARALIALAEHFPEALPEALAAARKIQNANDRAEALTALAARLPPELLPEALAAAREGAREIEDERRRAEVLTALAARLPPELLPEALAAAWMEIWIRKIKYADARARALIALAEHFPEALPEALAATREAAREIEDERRRAEVLTALAARLPELLPEALAAARKIQNAGARARALIALAEHFPEALPEALAVARKIQNANDRARALIALAEHFPEALPEALAAARKIQNANDRAEALTALAEHFPEALPEALAAARKIQDANDRAEALIALAARLPPELLPEALAAARKIQDANDRAEVLTALAARLPELLPEALAAARKIQDAGARARALTALARHFPEALPEALAAAREAAREIEDERRRAEVLTALAARLPELLPEALAAARKIQDAGARARALTALARHFPEALPEALAAAREIQNANDRARALAAVRQFESRIRQFESRNRKIKYADARARALTALAARLPPELLPEALAAARKIQDANDRAEVLTALAARLPPELLPEALAAAREIQNANDRARALTALARHFPEALPEALATAREIRFEFARAPVLADLSPRLAELPRPALYPLWDETLPFLARRTRRDLLADLRALVPVIHALGGEAAIAETARAIQDVARWWP